MKKRTIATLLFSLLIAFSAAAQEKKLKTGLWPEDWKYALADGVTTKEVSYYSDGVQCYAKLFLPKGFNASGKTPGVVLGQGWAGTHFSIEKYGAQLAERGLVAMTIDYRGWGASDGYVAVNEPNRTGGDYHRDETRVTKTKTEIAVRRTRLIPLKQVEDYRNAISYLQGEPEVDPDRIGVWGSSFAGGHTLVVAALDARVKAVVAQVPGIAGKNAPATAAQLKGKLLEDAIKRARTGQGDEYETGYSFRRMVDVETQQAVAEYRPFHYPNRIGARPVLLVVAAKEELINNRDNAYAALEVLTRPKKLIEVPGITHFEIYINEAFEISSNAAADWFREHPGLEQKGSAARYRQEIKDAKTSAESARLRRQ
ncbi:MAG: alpha/beta hydrolase [Blastocatellia bacterium]